MPGWSVHPLVSTWAVFILQLLGPCWSPEERDCGWVVAPESRGRLRILYLTF